MTALGSERQINNKSSQEIRHIHTLLHGSIPLPQPSIIAPLIIASVTCVSSGDAHLMRIPIAHFLVISQAPLPDPALASNGGQLTSPQDTMGPCEGPSLSCSLCLIAAQQLQTAILIHKSNTAYLLVSRSCRIHERVCQTAAQSHAIGCGRPNGTELD